jgi:hypothetical protein
VKDPRHQRNIRFFVPLREKLVANRRLLFGCDFPCVCSLNANSTAASLPRLGAFTDVITSMLNEEDEEERKPSFGTSLERFRAGVASAPSRRSDRKRSRGNTLDDAPIKEEEGDRLGCSELPQTPVKEDELSCVSSLSKPESVQDNSKEDSPSTNTATTAPPGSSRRGRSPKRRNSKA